MLGKTHEVTAPTGLLKVMESAVVDTGIPCRTRPDHQSMACLRGMYTHGEGSSVNRTPGCSDAVAS
jgi:hypothetical protein